MSCVNSVVSTGSSGWSKPKWVRLGNPSVWSASPVFAAARFQPSNVRMPIVFKCSATRSRRNFRIVASAATVPTRSVQLVLLMNVDCAASITDAVPRFAAIGYPFAIAFANTAMSGFTPSSM